MKPDSDKNTTVRVSFVWVLVLVFLVAGVGLAGGLVGQWLFTPSLPPLPSSGERLITTIQEVTVSPSMAAGEVVAKSNRSVVLLAPARRTGDVLATGLVVTSDGLLAAPLTATEEDLVALDYKSASVPLTKVADDTLFGLSYFRMMSGVFVPLEILETDVPVGARLLALSREEETLGVSARMFTVDAYGLPEAGRAAGVQRVMRGSGVGVPVFAGAPLLDDVGRVAGLYDKAGVALPAARLRESLDRVTQGRGEQNPLQRIGIIVEFDFTDTPEGRQFAPRVTAVGTASPAARAGVRPGDILQRVGDDEITWEGSLVGLMARELPFQMMVLRGEETHSLTLNET